MTPAGGAVHRLLASAGLRVATLPISGVATIISARLLTSEYGAGAYAIFALIASLPSLLPIADFGLGAAVTNAAAGLPQSANRYFAIVSRTRRILVFSGFTVAMISVALGIFGVWPSVLGLPSDRGTNLGAAVAMGIFGLTIPLSLGARVLIGMRRNSVVVLVQGLGPVVSLMLIWWASVVSLPTAIVLMFTMAGSAGVGITLALIAWGARRRVVSLSASRTNAIIPIWRMASATMILTLSLPLTFQVHRLLLSWVGDVGLVAVYSAGALVFFPVLSVIQMAGQSLWGDFAAARGSSVASRSILIRGNLICVILAAFGSIGLLVVGPPVATWSTSGLVEVPGHLFAAFAAVVLAQGFHITAGMMLTDDRGMRFQAVSSTCMALASLLLGLLLVPVLGASGPVVGTCISLLLCHAIPCQLKAFALTRR